MTDGTTQVADSAESWPVADRQTVWESGRVISIRSDTITSPSGESLSLIHI